MRCMIPATSTSFLHFQRPLSEGFPCEDFRADSGQLSATHRNTLSQAVLKVKPSDGGQNACWIR
jgi:hypothetical protein